MGGRGHGQGCGGGHGDGHGSRQKQFHGARKKQPHGTGKEQPHRAGQERAHETGQKQPVGLLRSTPAESSPRQRVPVGRARGRMAPGPCRAGQCLREGCAWLWRCLKAWCHGALQPPPRS